MNHRKLIIFSAPSGSGKTTIVKHLLATMPELSFSVSCTTRSPRAGEREGLDYYFVDEETFNQNIAADNFAEFEEVYPGRFYGTLKSEIERIWSQGQAVIFDIDAKGGLNLKKVFPKETLAIFLSPPSMEVLEQRLRGRNTEDEETMQIRMAAARKEMQLAECFDVILVNDDLEQTKIRARHMIVDFLKQEE